VAHRSPRNGSSNGGDAWFTQRVHCGEGSPETHGEGGSLTVLDSCVWGGALPRLRAAGIHAARRPTAWARSAGEATGIVTRDPADDMVLAAAIGGRADWAVSLDRHLIDLAGVEGGRVFSPGDFLVELRSRS
jgi:hypothetical protein